MIQRKQTVFLLLAVILYLVTLSMPVACVVSQGLTTGRVYCMLWLDQAGAAHFQCWPLFAILLLSAAVACYTIFIYKNRLRQALLCLVSMMLSLLWYVALIVVSKTLAPDAAEFQLAWPAVLPAVSVILTFMARKGILADEKLVRAADRLR
jgi:hypothetical protein